MRLVDHVAKKGCRVSAIVGKLALVQLCRKEATSDGSMYCTLHMKPRQNPVFQKVVQGAAHHLSMSSAGISWVSEAAIARQMLTRMLAHLRLHMFSVRLETFVLSVKRSARWEMDTR
jgi:hypothetical protein